MQFTTSLVATILAFTASTAAAPLEARQDALQEWEVSSVNWSSPSGRPGSYPWQILTAAITDPNAINLGPSEADGTDVIAPAGSQGLNCQAKWFRGESPLGRTWPCDPTGSGYWVMNVLEGGDGFKVTDFKLKFTRVVDVLYKGSQYKQSFEGTGVFGTNTNMRAVCGASGVCSYYLKDESKPVKIVQQKN